MSVQDIEKDAAHSSRNDAPADIRSASPEEGEVAEKSYAGSDDEDEAMKAMRAFGGEPIEIDEATNKRLLKKIDWHLMPVSPPDNVAA